MSTSNLKPKLGLIVDWETSGASFTTLEETTARFQGLYCGAVIFDTDTLLPVPGKTLKFKVKFDADRYEWTEQAEKIHGLSREHLAAEGLTSEEAALELAGFVMDNFGPLKVLFGGHNPYFDIAFTRQLLEPHGVMFPLHHVVLDSSPLGYILIGEYKSDLVFELLGGIDPRGLHDPVDDALASLAAMRSARQLVAAGLAAGA